MRYPENDAETSQAATPDMTALPQPLTLVTNGRGG
jgi:hypothetical protein